MSETINAIQERLSPQHLAEEAREAVLGATIGKAEQMVSDIQDTARSASSGLWDTIKENPVPAALAGIGLTWLFMGRRSRTPTWTGHNGYPDYVETRYGATSHGRTFYGPQTSGSERGLGSKAGEVAGQAKDTAGRVIEGAGEMASDATERAAELAMGAGERAVDMASTMGSTTRDAGTTLWANIRANPIPAAIAGVGLAWLAKGWDSSAADRIAYRSHAYEYEGSGYGYRTRRHADNPAGEVIMQADHMGREALSQADHLRHEALSQADHLRQKATGKAQSLLDDSPLVLGALALGLGAAAGLAAPSTRRERELMGEARDTLMERTASVLQDTQERVKSVAEEAQRTIKDEMRKDEMRAEKEPSSGMPPSTSSTTPQPNPSGPGQGSSGQTWGR